MQQASSPTSRWFVAMPAAFVFIWSTGYVVARFGMPYAPPMTFLALRFALCIGVFALLVALARLRLPREARTWRDLAVCGALIHAGYLGGVWAAVKLGMNAGTIALIIGLQPILTALLIASGGERFGARTWLGLAVGFVGLALVVEQKMIGGEITASNLALGLFALIAIVLGTVYQKRKLGAVDFRVANLIQLCAALIFALPFALFEREAMRWNAQLAGAMAWSVLVLTLGGNSLMYLLFQRRAAVSAASLIYLVPPVTALMGWALFGETLGVLALVGTGLVVVAVAMVTRKP